MEKEFRKTGIDIIGDAPWGTHLCQFYETREDLVNILVPYFKAGLENNEFCMWITSEPLKVEDAKAELKKVVKNLDHFIKKGQIEILDYSEWYTKSGKFDANNVLQGWVEKENQALKRGYDGLRLSGNTFWLAKRDWRNFTDYEEEVNNVIRKYRMIAICTYSLGQCGASEVIDVVSNHQFALIRREGKWVIIESSDRKRTEEALGESEEWYRALFESINDAVLVSYIDEEGSPGCFIQVNDVACQRLGYTREELLGLTPRDITPPEEYMKLLDKRENLMSTGDIINETVHVTRDGRQIPVESSVRLFNYLGKRAVISISRDITERKRAEEALRESEENFRRSLGDSPLGVRIVTTEGETLYANRAILNIYGYDSIEELRTTPVKERYTPESCAEFQIRMEKRQQGEYAPTEYEISIVRKDGKVRHLKAFRKETLWNGERQFQTLYQDITERKKAEDLLRESKEFTESLIASMQDGFSVLDSHFVHIGVNPAFCQMTGFSREELIGVGTPHPYWPPEAYQEIETAFQKTLRGEFGDIELTFMRKNGERFPVIVSPSWVKDNQGNVTSYFATVKDITERKQAEQEKLRLEERSRKVVEDIFRFIPEGVLVFSRKMEFLRQNQSFRELVSGYAQRLGFAEDELGNLIIDKIKAGMGDKKIKEIRISRKHETGK
jgi:hypothetical protein